MTAKLTALPLLAGILTAAAGAGPAGNPAAPTPEPDPFAAHLTGDWGGLRRSLAGHGVSLDLEYTLFYQGLGSGDGYDNWDFGGRADAFVNLDTEKLGLWSGGGMRTHFEFRHGDLRCLRGGALWPVNTGMLLPLGEYEETVATSICLTQRAGSRGVEPAIGIASPMHLMVTEPGGKAIVIEFTAGAVKIHEAPLGVITNAPNYDWHMTNLRNYVNLSAIGLPTKTIEDLNFAPLGGGSGMIEMPGDYTPPSRFVRAVAFSKTARPTATGTETMPELFRILDSFNVPLGAAEGEESKTQLEGLRSSTCWTSGYDTKNLIMQYHTQHNRRVRQVDLEKIDFSRPGDLIRLPLDREKTQDLIDVTPAS